MVRKEYTEQQIRIELRIDSNFGEMLREDPENRDIASRNAQNLSKTFEFSPKRPQNTRKIREIPLNPRKCRFFAFSNGFPVKLNKMAEKAIS